MPQFLRVENFGKNKKINRFEHLANFTALQAG